MSEGVYWITLPLDTTFGRWRAERVLAIAQEGEPDGIHGTLVMGVLSVETAFRNVLGDRDVGTGHFHARGAGQINDRFWQSWLDRIPGCDAGEWEVSYDTCGPAGRVPRLSDTTRFVIRLLKSFRVEVERAGVPAAESLRVAIAAFNCGVWYAVKGWKNGNPDEHTTGARYSEKVLEHQEAIRRFIQTRGWKPHTP